MKNQAADKKQIAVLGVLLTVMLGVGAFQLMGGSPPPQKPVVKKEDAAAGGSGAVAMTDPTPVDGTRDPNLKPLEQTDPFEPEGGWKGDDPVKEPAKTPDGGGTGETTPKPDPKPQPGPVAGNFGKYGYEELPMAKPGDPTAPAPPGGPVAIQPERDTVYCAGIINGAEPMAILADETGKQTLVKLGGKYKNARLKSVGSRHVVVEYAGKKRTELRVSSAPEKPDVSAGGQPAAPAPNETH